MQLFVHHDNQRQGPLDLELVRARLAEGSFSGSDLAWHEGLAGWIPLATVPALAGAIPPTLTPPPVASSSPGQVPVYATQPRQTSGLAVASMILGIVSLFLAGLTSIPAVICGHRSLARIRQSSGGVTGEGVAITGLVTGYIGLAIFGLFFLGLLAGIALPVFSVVQERGLAAKSLEQAKGIGLACKMYAAKHDGNFPGTLDELVPDFLHDQSSLLCPLAKNGWKNEYDYFGGKQTDPANEVLLSSQATTRDHKKVVVYKDGSGSLVKD